MKKNVLIAIVMVSIFLVAGLNSVRAASNPSGQPFDAIWTAIYALQTKCTNNMTDYVLKSDYNAKVAVLEGDIANLQVDILNLETRIAALEAMHTICSTGNSANCGINVGACAFGTKTCANGDWSACTGGTWPVAETCNNIDDDCDGMTDEELGQICGSNVGICTLGWQTCSFGNWICIGATSPTTETCNGLDDDCDGTTDEGVMSTYYRDADGDGYGNPGLPQNACAATEGYVSNNGDCNDADANINHGAVEVCDGRDNNCNGQVDEVTSCTDGNACTTGDYCTNGMCIGSPINCDDGDICTIDMCDVHHGCSHIWNC